jgi:hypothetical protein
MTKSIPVIAPWVIICIAAPVTPTCPRAAAPSNTYPMWLTLEYAIRRFRSVCLMVTSAP